MTSTGPSRKTVDLLMIRDEGRCAKCAAYIRGGRGEGWSVHHRRARGSGGDKANVANRLSNLILLCGSGTTGCHGWVESNRKSSYILGLLVHRNGITMPTEEPIFHAAHLGWVYLDDDGGWEETDGQEGLDRR